MSTELRAWLHPHRLLVKVQKHAPANREQWQDWNLIWPMSWRIPELKAVTAATAAANAVSEAEQRLRHHWMDRAINLAEANQASEEFCNAAVIVDPASGEQLSVKIVSISF